MRCYFNACGKEKLKNHIHVRIYNNGGCCGDLVFTPKEWPEIKNTFTKGGAEVIEDQSLIGNTPRCTTQEEIIQQFSSFRKEK